MWVLGVFLNVLGSMAISAGMVRIDDTTSTGLLVLCALQYACGTRCSFISNT
jgi:hypothetical protein